MVKSYGDKCGQAGPLLRSLSVVLTLHSKADETDGGNFGKSGWDLLHGPEKFIMTGLWNTIEEDSDGVQKPERRCF